MGHRILFILFLFALAGCSEDSRVGQAGVAVPAIPPRVDTLVPDDSSAFHIRTGGTSPDSLLRFAHSLIGTPYVYGCTKPETGFDCSGFIWYVFNHFGIEVPRSSVDFTNVGQSVPLSEASPADLILFTGTDPSIRTVGHMGIVVYHTADSLSFIHSSSGAAQGVTLSYLDDHYTGRFMKIIRVFPLTAH